MSETNEKGNSFLNFLKQIFSKTDKSPGKRSSNDHNGKNDFQLSIQSEPKRKTKRIAPQPPLELTNSLQTSSIYEPSHSQKNDAATLNDIERGISELTLSDHNSNLKKASLARVHTESDSSKKRKVKHTKSSKTKKESNAVPKIKKKSSKYDDMKNTKSENFFSKKSSTNSVASESKSAEAENDQALLKLQTDSKNDKPILEIESLNNEQSNIIAEKKISQILENETHQIETTKCSQMNESLKEEIENKSEGDIALEEIESVMQEVESLKLEMQNVNNSDTFFAIEMGLTNAIIKLDGIQMPKDELLKKKRKEGIILIHELFKQLDEQGK